MDESWIPPSLEREFEERRKGETIYGRLSREDLLRETTRRHFQRTDSAVFNHLLCHFNTTLFRSPQQTFLPFSPSPYSSRSARCRCRWLSPSQLASAMAPFSANCFLLASRCHPPPLLLRVVGTKGKINWMEKSSWREGGGELLNLLAKMNAEIALG